MKYLRQFFIVGLIIFTLNNCSFYEHEKDSISEEQLPEWRNEKYSRERIREDRHKDSVRHFFSKALKIEYISSSGNKFKITNKTKKDIRSVSFYAFLENEFGENLSAADYYYNAKNISETIKSNSKGTFIADFREIKNYGENEIEKYNKFFWKFGGITQIEFVGGPIIKLEYEEDINLVPISEYTGLLPSTPIGSMEEQMRVFKLKDSLQIENLCCLSELLLPGDSLLLTIRKPKLKPKPVKREKVEMTEVPTGSQSY